MFNIALKLFKSAITINVFIIIQLTIVLSTTAFMVSALYSRIEFYLPIKDILNEKASAVSFSSEYINKIDNCNFLLDYKTSPLKQELKGVTDLYTRYSPYISSENINLSVKSYDDSLIDLYTPKLQNGKWLNSISSDYEYSRIPAVIYQNNYSFNVGDTFEGVAKTYENKDFNVCFEVIGIIDSDTMIFGNSNEPLNNHLSFYETPASIFDYEIESDESVIMAIVPNRIITDSNIVAFYDASNAIVTYDDGISNKDVMLNTSELNMRYGGFSENIWTIREKSLNYVKSQLLMLLPIVICISILAIISGICVSAIITKRNLKKYVIFYICGINWNRCMLICFFNSICISLISVILSLLVLSLLPVFFNISIFFNLYSVVIYSVILLIFIFMSATIAFRILKSSTPCEIIKDK